MQPALVVPPRAGAAGSAGHLLRLVRSGGARSRSDLVALTGVSRSTVSLRVDQLLRAQLLSENGTSGSTGGRPPRLLSFNGGCGAVLAIDLGVTRAVVAVADLSGTVLARRRTPTRVADGPDAVLAQVDALAQRLLTEAGVEDRVCAIGIGLPGPVEFSRGRPVHPPVMPGWHDHDVPGAFAHYGCPVLVDNDVNVMAAGELDADPHPVPDFLVVKVGTGIGCGIVLDGELYRGSAGSAGDIGHIHVPHPRRVLCGCGNENCLESIAGGAALARDARAQGLPVEQPSDLVDLALDSDPQALRLVRDAGRLIGEVLAGLVNFFNPSRIVVTGGVARAGNPLIAGIREAVYRRSLPLAARSLDISISTLSDRAGCAGAARMAIEAHLADARVEQLLSEGAP